MRERAILVGLALVGPAFAWIMFAMFAGPGFNDFNDYWLAGRLVDLGQSPHDLGALTGLARAEGRDFVIGTGYSYPLPFAIAMVPLSRLPFTAALAVFLAGSLAVYGLAIAGWLRWAHAGPIDAWRLRLVALLAGFYPPVIGTVANGQANLLVLGLLAPGLAWILGSRPSSRLAGGLLAGLATVVKLVPGIIVVPLVLGRRAGAATAIVVGAIGSLALASVVAPRVTAGGESLLSLLAPDPYFTNVSINGFVSRLVMGTDRTTAVLPGAFDPEVAMALATAVFAGATAAVLWRSRSGLIERRGLALGIGLALLAAVIGAPKNSFWNQSLALVPVALLLAVDAPNLRIDRFDRLDRWLIAAWLLGSAVQMALWLGPVPATSLPVAGLVTLAGSSALYGMLALWWVFARRLPGGIPPPPPPRPVPALSCG